MKKVLLVVLAIFFSSGVAMATPYTFTETFLGPEYDNGTFITDPSWFLTETSELSGDPGEGRVARFDFDLTRTGNTAKLLDGTQPPPVDKIFASYDEDSFDSTIYDPFKAILDVYVFDDDRGKENRELIRVKVSLDEGGRTDVLYKDVQLGTNPDRKFRIKFDENGLLEQVADGQLTAFVIALSDPDITNDFYVDEITLTVKANPVPEPGTMVLLGFGLIGLATYTRKRSTRR